MRSPEPGRARAGREWPGSGGWKRQLSRTGAARASEASQAWRPEGLQGAVEVDRG